MLYNPSTQLSLQATQPGIFCGITGLLPTAGNIHEQVQKINQNLLALERKINDSKKSTHSATKIGKAVMLFESWQIERTAEIRGMLHDRCA